MIIGIGVDIVNVSRLKISIERFGDRFLKRVFTSKELEDCLGKANQFEKLAARFAAKEATVKAIGIGLRNGITWQDIEVRNDGMGKPEIHSYGKCKQMLHVLSVSRVHVSLSHSDDSAIAMVVLEKKTH
ncbi:MAG: holo-ACP synthase [Calditrichaeota bacterium]|nr:holo-ACP synthase [Calditrichota bacterium]